MLAPASTRSLPRDQATQLRLIAPPPDTHPADTIDDEPTDTPGMDFNVGPWIYTARISKVPIIWKDKSRLGYCCEHTAEILISCHCAYDRRLSVLLHELAHAWSWLTAEPENIEEVCDTAAVITVSLLRDIDRFGGLPALDQFLRTGVPPALTRAPHPTPHPAVVELPGLGFRVTDVAWVRSSPDRSRRQARELAQRIATSPNDYLAVCAEHHVPGVADLRGLLPRT